MRGEREIRPKWPAIYTFLGRDKWWQKWWQMGWVITFPMTDCELFTSRPWLRLRPRLEAVFAIGGNNLSDLPPNGIDASVVKPFLLACSMLLLPSCFHFTSTLLPLCFLLCGWNCFHMLMTNHHMPISNNSNIKVSNERKGWPMAEQHICMLSGHYSIAWSGRVSDRWGGHWHMRTRGGSICPNVWICNIGTFQRD